MMRTLAVVLALGLAPFALSASQMNGQETYDMLFRNGTLDAVDKDVTLVYSRDVKNTLKPEAEDRDTGDIALSFKQEQAVMAQLELRQDDKKRGLGRFPASVGNPMIMFFYETTVRDMAEAAGGSPFYIRNRVKDALVQPSELEEGQAVVNGQTISTKTVRLHPFLDDPNRDQMKGFGDLQLTVTMSDDIPGWYMSLIAEAGDVYRSEVRFDGLEASQ